MKCSSNFSGKFLFLRHYLFYSHNLLEKYQIKISQFLCGKYVKKFLTEENNELPEIANKQTVISNIELLEFVPTNVADTLTYTLYKGNTHSWSKNNGDLPLSHFYNTDSNKYLTGIIGVGGKTVGDNLIAGFPTLPSNNDIENEVNKTTKGKPYFWDGLPIKFEKKYTSIDPNNVPKKTTKVFKL